MILFTGLKYSAETSDSQADIKQQSANKATVDCLNWKHNHHQLSDSAERARVTRADTTCSLHLPAIEASRLSYGTIAHVCVFNRLQRITLGNDT